MKAGEMCNSDKRQADTDADVTPEMVRAAADVYFEWAGDTETLSTHYAWENGSLPPPSWVKLAVEAALRANPNRK